MGIRERREKEKAELKKKILCAAEELFSESGYQNISMRKIAEKIEYSLPTIYQFFENKADILFHIYNQFAVENPHYNEGYFLSKDASVISQCLWAGMHGLASLFIGHSEFPWQNKECLIENMIDSLVGSES